MRRLNRVADVRKWRRAVSPGFQGITFVPTMGALHEGHLSLMRYAREVSRGPCIASIFVNPTQFGPNEDYDRYPRTLDTDLTALRSLPEPPDAVWLPDAGELYDSGFRTHVVPDPADHGEAQQRPHFLRGVATVVTKLLNVVQPHVLILGRKDLQQALMVRRMVTDLNMPVRVDIAPTIRDETTGLALSSRNAYLSPNEVKHSSALYDALQAGVHAWSSANTGSGTDELVPPDALADVVRRHLEAHPDLVASIDYVDVVDASTGAAVRTMEQLQAAIHRFQTTGGDAANDFALALTAAIRTPDTNVRLLDNVVL